MEQLEQILRDCHLHDDCPEAPDTVQQSAPCLSASSGIPTRSTADNQSSSWTCVSATSVATAKPWADELVQRLQGCSDFQEAHPLCVNALAALVTQLQQPQAPAVEQSADRDRLNKLQHANKVIVRALRTVSERQRDMAARAQQAEQANVHLLAELQTCREQLLASQRSNATLQSHLQLMSAGSGQEAAPEWVSGPTC